MNTDELRICELERYNVDQAAKIVKLYREIEELRNNAQIDTVTIQKLENEIDQIKKIHRADIFVFTDKMDRIREITESELEVGKQSSSSHQAKSLILSQ